MRAVNTSGIFEIILATQHNQEKQQDLRKLFKQESTIRKGREGSREDRKDEASLCNEFSITVRGFFLR